MKKPKRTRRQKPDLNERYLNDVVFDYQFQNNMDAIEFLKSLINRSELYEVMIRDIVRDLIDTNQARYLYISVQPQNELELMIGDLFRSIWATFDEELFLAFNSLSTYAPVEQEPIVPADFWEANIEDDES